MTNDSGTRRLAQIQRQLPQEQNDKPKPQLFPILPPGAQYLVLDNAKKRNALSIAVLRDLRDQLHNFNRSPIDGKVRILPPFHPEVLNDLEAAVQHTSQEATQKHGWLVDPDEWNKHRAGLPRVIVLRTEGSVFCSGHDLSEMNSMNYDQVKELFALCAEVMSLIRRSPVPVIGVVHGLATAAGAQLALTLDLPIAHGSTQFRLPGSAMGLSCISPVTAVSRRVGDAFAYQMLALSEPCRADELPGQPIHIVDENTSLDEALEKLLIYYTQGTAGQCQALGKWAFWTQTGFNGTGNSAADGYEDATVWTGKVMALLAQTSEAREGFRAFLEKRKPQWKT